VASRNDQSGYLPNCVRNSRQRFRITANWIVDRPSFYETFWLVDGTLEHKEKIYPAYIYYPCPSDVKVHLDNTKFEILAEKIEGLDYGDAAAVTVDATKVRPKS
jgi:hypothetical protein